MIGICDGEEMMHVGEMCDDVHVQEERDDVREECNGVHVGSGD